jgi:hypothetical protein
MRETKQLACLRFSARVLHSSCIHVYKNMIVPPSPFSESNYYNKWIWRERGGEGFVSLRESGELSF